MNQRRHVRRQAERTEKLDMTIIPFGTLEGVEIAAHTVDMGPGGLGITADCALEPGFVVIRQGTEEGKKGVLVWTQAQGISSCRAGIQFITTHENSAAYSQNKTDQTYRLPAFQDPRLVTSILVDVMERPQKINIPQ